MHPHDSDSLIRLAFVETTSGKTAVKEIMTTVMVDAIKIIESIITTFTKGRVKKNTF
jgi:hypothetical protein